MSYTEVIFRVDPPSPGSEIMMAMLSEIGYESFEETETGLKAYIPSENFNAESVDRLIREQRPVAHISYEFTTLADKNWNEVWESNYPPVMIAGQVYVRAPFHEEREARYQLLIEPKMSFGTAHHETTHLMMEMMLEEDFQGARVLDMGCGTGILAILSEMLGADLILAIDNDPNACINARENVIKNKCRKIVVQYGASEMILGMFDVILANITRNILVQDLPVYVSHLNAGGRLLVSGFYREDLAVLKREALKNKLAFGASAERNGWSAARFTKH